MRLAAAALSIQFNVNSLGSGRGAMARSLGVKLTLRVIHTISKLNHAAVRRVRLSEMVTRLAVIGQLLVGQEGFEDMATKTVRQLYGPGNFFRIRAEKFSSFHSIRVAHRTLRIR
jgi:hypothetical protein